MRALWRLGLWGIWAALALAAVVWSAQSDLGVKRLAAAMPAPPDTAAAPSAAEQLLALSMQTENETRRLADELRALTADRDRLLARIQTLERNMDEVTESIAHVRSAAQRSSNSAIATAGATAVSSGVPAPVASPPQTSSDAGRMAALSQPAPTAPTSPPPWPAPNSSISPPTNIHEMPTGSIATRTEFGIDLGAGNSIDALRSLWVSIRSKHAGLVDGLRPVVAIREGSRPGKMELRLVAGPLVNAATAARLCGVLAAAGLGCQPALFDGQRLALR
jgi:cell division septation protein DedD